MWNVFRDIVCHGSLEICPDKLVGIELGSIPRKKVAVDSTMPAEELLHGNCPVDCVIVPQQNNVASKVSQEVLKKLKNLLGSDILLGVKSEIEPEPSPVWRDTESRDSRELGPGSSWDLKMGCSSPWCPRPGNTWHQQEPAFIQEDDIRPKRVSFFLSQATLCASTVGWPVRCVLSHASPASGNSIPATASTARDWEWNSRCRSASRPSPQYASVSTDRYCTQLSGGLRRGSVQAPVSAPWTAAEADQGLAWAAAHFVHPCGIADTIVPRNSMRISPERPQSGNCDQLSATLLHAACAFRVSLVFHGVSFPVIYKISR
jgi:hypothetical protein